MEVYHGSTIGVKEPLVNIGRANLDFGKGFYVTTLHDQAASWACRPINANKPKWISTFEFDYDAVKEAYQVKIFPKYDEEWLDFVLACRQGSSVWESYDVVQGGIANDKIFNTIELFTAGLISKAETLSRLAYELPNNQICIHRQEIIDNHLQFIKSEQL